MIIVLAVGLSKLLVFAKKHFTSQYDAHCDDFECLVDKFLHFENLQVELADLLKDLGTT